MTIFYWRPHIGCFCRSGVLCAGNGSRQLLYGDTARLRSSSDLASSCASPIRVLNWKWPYIDAVTGRVSLRVNQITLTMETKTKDNVFVTIPISVQNRVRPEKVFDAFYKLSNPVEQINPMSSR